KAHLGLRPLALSEASREAARFMLTILSDDDALLGRVAQLGARCGLKTTPGAITPFQGAGSDRLTMGTLAAGPRAGFEKMFEVLAASGVAEEADLARRGDSAMMEFSAPRDIVCGSVTVRAGSLAASARPLVMGILNVTPDSFSDGGRYASAEAAVARGVEMVEQGADILDVGGESTRPGSARVDAETEIARVAPVIEALASRVKAPISIDTTKAVVARRAAAAGATIVNDISGLAMDGEMAGAVADLGLPVVLNHLRGVPETMQAFPDYEHIVLEVLLELAARCRAAKEAGIAASKILVDPGFGFGKRAGDNYTLLRHLGVFRALGAPILAGVSRKSFLGAATGRAVADRAASTIAAEVIAATAGAEILRTHQPRETIDALRVARAAFGHPSDEALP
ncbi:MAG TPA: dihydropteroate synthase, partial [Verrucomicrobiae bacterium]|nr:dihydropteroate synthase [Verrucomicrobiae bacterium]